MPFNGSGTYTRPAGQPVVAGTDILDTTFNNYTADVATALTNCVTRDGQSPATANIPMGGFKLTGVGNATATTDALTIASVSAATTKATPVDADEFAIADSAASFGLKKLTWANLKATLFSGATFTGLVNLASGANIASAATVDLTAATGNTVTITGTTATTAFTMNDGQHMTLVAGGALPLTYHATTCNILGGADITAYTGQIFHVFKSSGVVYVSPQNPKAIYGGMILTAAATPAAATWTKFAVSSESSGNSGVTFSDVGDSITVTTSGVYHVDATCGYLNTAAAKRGEVALYINGAISGTTQTAAVTTQIAGLTNRQSKGFNVSLSAGDVLTMYGWSVDANGTFNANDCVITLHRIGA